MKNISPDNKQLAWKNVAEILKLEDGFRIQRVPEEWRKKFPEGAAWRSMQSANVRLLLKTDSSKVALKWQAGDMERGQSPAP